VIFFWPHEIEAPRVIFSALKPIECEILHRSDRKDGSGSKKDDKLIKFCTEIRFWREAISHLSARMLNTSTDFTDFLQIYNPFNPVNLRNLWIIISTISLPKIPYLGLLDGIY